MIRTRRLEKTSYVLYAPSHLLRRQQGAEQLVLINEKEHYPQQLQKEKRLLNQNVGQKSDTKKNFVQKIFIHIQFVFKNFYFLAIQEFLINSSFTEEDENKTSKLPLPDKRSQTRKRISLPWNDEDVLSPDLRKEVIRKPKKYSTNVPSTGLYAQALLEMKTKFRNAFDESTKAQGTYDGFTI